LFNILLSDGIALGGRSHLKSAAHDPLRNEYETEFACSRKKFLLGGACIKVIEIHFGFD
jgi:hypothetical protein